jgi:hypothetical protein
MVLDVHSLYDSWMQKKSLKVLFWFLFGGIVGLVASSIAIMFFELQIEEQTGLGVLDIEFVWTVARTEEVLALWGTRYISAEIVVNFLDFLFMPAYATVFTFISWILTRKLHDQEMARKSSSKASIFFFKIGFLPWVAVLFDVIENINILMILWRPDSFASYHPFVVSLCASIKFGLLGLVILGILVQIGILLKFRTKNK